MKSKTDRLPPHSMEAEQAVLGSLLMDPQSSIPAAIEVIGQDHDIFYDMRHQTIYQSVLRLFEKNEPVDIVTLYSELKRSQLDAQVGGTAYLSKLVDDHVSSANLRTYLKDVFDRWIARRLIHVATESIAEVYDTSDSAEELLDRHEGKVMAIRARCTTGQLLDMRVLTNTAIQYIEKLHERGGNLLGLPTGFPDLDRMTFGLQGGEMIVIAAFPGQGKTSLAMNIAEFVAVECQAPVGVFSAEMTAHSLVHRMLCSRARVNLRNVRDGFLAERDFPRITNAAGKLAKAPLFIDDSSGLSILQLRAKARRMWAMHKIKLLVVDYLQLLNAGGKRASDSRQDEVATISRGVKTLSKELNIPIIVLSQLNDDGKLRESRAIGQDADYVWFLEKPHGQEGADLEGDAQSVNLKIGKARNGPTGTIPLVFLRGITRFESASKIDDREDFRQGML